jgi:CRP-like cAMP-binding protein
VDQTHKVEMLRKFALFTGFTDRRLSLLGPNCCLLTSVLLSSLAISNYNRVEVPANKVLVKAGQVSQHLYLLVSGEVHVTGRTREALVPIRRPNAYRTVRVITLGAGEMFAESGLIAQMQQEKGSKVRIC